MTFREKSTRYVSDWKTWLKEPRLLWLTLASIIVIPIVFVVLCWVTRPWFGRDASDGLRYAGLLFQGGGIVTVVLGISARRRLFDEPDVFETVKGWWSRRPRWGRQPQTHALTVSGGVKVGGSAQVGIWHGKIEGASTEVLLKRLWENVENLAKKQQEDNVFAREQIAGLARANSDTAGEVKSVLADIKRRAKDHAVGSIQWEMMGVAWLFWGVVLATIPGECAALLKVVGG